MEYTVCKVWKLTSQLHDWFASPEWAALLVCEEWYLQEVILPQPGIYAVDSNGADVVAECDLKALGLHPE